MITRGLFTAVALGLAVAAAGCISLGPGDGAERTFYRLEIPAAPRGGPQVPGSIAVRPFAESEALAREGIRYLESGVHGGYWSSHRWSEPVATMVQDAVVADLESAELFRAVLMLEGLPSADFLLGAMVHRFEEQDRGDDWYAVVEITFEVARARGGEVVYHRRHRAEERCPEREVPDVVSCLSVAMGRILADLRADLAASCGGAAR